MTIGELRQELSLYSDDKEVMICLDGDEMEISSVDFDEDENWVTINS